MMENSLDALAGIRCPAGAEEAFVAALAALVGDAASTRLDGLGNLLCERGDAGTTVIVPISEPTFLLSGQGEKLWAFGTFGPPKDPRLLLHREVLLEDGRAGVISGPPESEDVLSLGVALVGDGTPRAGAWAVWPGRVRLQEGHVMGPGAASKALAAAAVTHLRETTGPARVLFAGTGFSARKVDRFLRDEDAPILWLHAFDDGAKLGQGAFQLAAPGLPARLKEPGRIQFLEPDRVPGVAAAARQAGLPSQGIGVACHYPGEPLEILSEDDLEDLVGALSAAR